MFFGSALYKKIRLGPVFMVGAFTVLSVTSCLSAAPLQGVGGAEPVSETYTQLSWGQALSLGGIDHKKFMDGKALEAFYAQRENRPYWSEGFKRTQDLVEALEMSWMHGLNPETYHLTEIRKLKKAKSEADLFRFDVLLSDAFVRYMHDLSGIRVDPSSLRSSAEYWRKAPEALEILGMLPAGGRVRDVLHSVEPQGQTYKALQKELVRLSREGEESYASILPLDFDGALMKPGWRHARIPDLRLRLGVQAAVRDERLYDDRLAASVMAFQRENGLEADAVIGSNTLQVLNRTNQRRVMQVMANMERLRWVPEKKPDRFVIVNIPSATLWAVDKGHVRFEMPVIVGKAVRPTNSFITEIKGVRFNPDWTVPSTIKRFDILPKIQEDPEYLQNKGIELISGYGKNAQTLDPASVDWKGISKRELNALRMVQVPGEQNPLGRVRILMPNKYNIYLHDTNHPELFERTERAASSGCIRLHDPEKMATFVLEGREGWGGQNMAEALSIYKTADIEIEKTMPVYVLYSTMWLDEGGTLVYGSDIYGQDEKLIKMLSNIDGLYIPVDNNGYKAGIVSDTSVASVR